MRSLWLVWVLCFGVCLICFVVFIFIWLVEYVFWLFGCYRLLFVLLYVDLYVYCPMLLLLWFEFDWLCWIVCAYIVVLLGGLFCVFNVWFGWFGNYMLASVGRSGVGCLLTLLSCCMVGLCLRLWLLVMVGLLCLGCVCFVNSLCCFVYVVCVWCFVCFILWFWMG